MTADQSGGSRRDGLQQLLTLTPNASRAQRTRDLCHEELRRRRWRAASRTAVAVYTWRVAGPVVVGGVCLLYAVALLATTLRLTLR